MWGTVEDKWGKVDNSRVVSLFTPLELYTNFSTALSPTFTQGYPQEFYTIKSRVIKTNRHTVSSIMGIDRAVCRFLEWLFFIVAKNEDFLTINRQVMIKK